MGNRALQYLTAERVRAEFPEAVIENIHLIEWGRSSPTQISEKTTAAHVGEHQYRIDVVGLADCLRRRVIDTLIIDGYPFHVDQYPTRAAAKRLFGETVSGSSARGFGRRELVCSVRGNEILGGGHGDYIVLPPDYYQLLADRTGLELVFYGQLESNAYTQSLRDAFPKARFIQSINPGFDFDTLRRSVHLAPSVSTFSWLAAWLSDAETVIVPVGGLFNPVQHPGTMFLPFEEPSYQFVLIPYTKAIDIHSAVNSFYRQQKVIAKYATFMDARSARGICARAATFGKERVMVGGFDPRFYTNLYADIARYVNEGNSALDHYMKYGAREGRQPLNFDESYYVDRYVDAAMEVSAAFFPSPLRHFMDVGWRKGYLPVPPAQK